MYFTARSSIFHGVGLGLVLAVIVNDFRVTYAHSAEQMVFQTFQHLQDQEVFNSLIGNELQYELAKLFVTTPGNIYANTSSDGEPSAIPAWLAIVIKWLEGEADKILVTVSKPCSNSLKQLAEAVQGGARGNKSATWAFKFLDATGKFGSSFLEGNQQVLGSFAECLDITSDPTSPLDSRYCTTRIGINSTAPSNPEMTSASLGLSFGTCFPAQCTTNDVTILSNVMLNQTISRVKKLQAIFVQKVQCDSNLDEWHFNGPAIVAIVILAVSFFLLAAGTLVDAGLRVLADRQAINNPTDRALVKDIERNSALMRLLLCWSILRNGNKILSVEAAKSVRSGDAGVPPLHSIHGIRFISMCWVILCHSYAFSVSAMKDPVRFVNDVGHWYFQPLSNASFSVDTFFFLSGMLLAYVVTAQERYHRRINWVQYYIHRYWRLTPPYMLTLAVTAGLYKYLAWGPWWNAEGWFPNQCADSWWTNLLYVNNFFALDKACMAWSWYLANDMQFYVISPLFIIPFFYRKSFGIAAWSFLMLAFFAATIAVTVTYKLPASFIAAVKSTGDKSIFWTYFTVYYVKPWTRIGPYLVGVAFGYILYQAKTKNWRLKWWQTAIGWPASLAISAAIIFSLRGENAGEGNVGLVAASFYNILSRPAWGIILGFVIFACETGSGGFINTVFSFPGFTPLSRLCYCAYLVHPAIQMWVYGAMTSQFSYSKITMSILSFGFIFAAFSMSFVVSLLFESPALGLEKFVTSLLSKLRSATKGGVDNGAFTHSDLATVTSNENDEAGYAPAGRVPAAGSRRKSAVTVNQTSQSVNNDGDT